MKRYFFDSSGNSICKVDVNIPLLSPIYDDIVDKSTYIPNSEVLRKSVISGQGLSKKGVYDTDKPSPFMLLLRSGKLDKAEVSDYIREHSSKALKEAAEALESLKTSDDKTKTATPDINSAS